MQKLKQEITTVNETTGEITTVSKIYSTKVEQDSFYMCFIEYLKPWYNLTGKAQKILAHLCSNAAFDTGVISLAKADRADICEMFNLQPSNLSAILTSLKKENLITGEGGRYTINPLVFWKGKLETRNQLLKEGKLSITINLASK